jgi:ubiquinone/menaquinone biosynthesis C-methylase UbiE
MLPRILEPEVMDTPEEATSYNTMDHSAVNTLFVTDLLAMFAETPPPRSRNPFTPDDEDAATLDILDLGTGTAQIVVELCSRLAECRVMAADAAASMLDLALYNIEVSGHRHRIQLDQIDAKALHYSDGQFGVVMSNSLIHHIPEPFVALKEAVRVTMPGGLLFFRDLLRPESTEQLTQLVQSYAGNEEATAQKMFAESLHAALTLDEIREMISSLGFDVETVQQTSDRHWTWKAVKSADCGIRNAE